MISKEQATSSASQPDIARNEFEHAGQEKQPSVLQEVVAIIVEEKKWWMVPIVAVLSVVGLVVLFASTGAAPFIYTLF